MKPIKFLLKLIIERLSTFLIYILPKTLIGNYFYNELVKKIMDRKESIIFNDNKLIFATPNKLTQYRKNTFSTKEPETLEWIENIDKESVLWDVGANVGLYSIYAAKVQNCKVFAFEPSVFNLEVLARNVYLNNLHNSIAIIPLALNNKIGENIFKLSNTDWGGALSSFGVDFDQTGEKLDQIFEYKTFGLTIDEACKLLKIPAPHYLKMDVDGIEHLILKGAESTLKQVKSVLIEINDAFTNQANESSKILKKSGLVLHKKCDIGVQNQYNQWWVRPKIITRS